MIKLIKKQIKNGATNTILFIADLFHIDLLRIAYNRIGILNHKNQNLFGENYFIRNILHEYITSDQPILFDIGANIGKYSTLLRQSFPKAQIYSFEPNRLAFKELSDVSPNEKLNSFNIGLSSDNKKVKIYFDKNNTELSSLYENVFSVIHDNSSVESEDVDVKSLDGFCEENHIDHIDFIKIDTEGHELEILRGAKNLIRNNNIKIIQFEFNEMNIISRVFLKDFYDELSGFNIYRIYKDKLIDISTYQSSNEIFRLQNIVAISKTK